jgi:hypothetical protein
LLRFVLVQIISHPILLLV